MPWPGREAWKDEETLYYCDPLLFDLQGTGRAKNRDDCGYKDAKGNGAQKQKMEGNYRVTKQE